MISVKQKHRYLKQLLIAAAIAAISLSSVAQTSRVNLPELGNSASNMLSVAEEREYAESLIRQMRLLPTAISRRPHSRSWYSISPSSTHLPHLAE